MSSQSLLLRYMHSIFGRSVLAFEASTLTAAFCPQGPGVPSPTRMLGRFVQVTVYMDVILVFS